MCSTCVSFCHQRLILSILFDARRDWHSSHSITDVSDISSKLNIRVTQCDFEFCFLLRRQTKDWLLCTLKKFHLKGYISIFVDAFQHCTCWSDWFSVDKEMTHLHDLNDSVRFPFEMEVFRKSSATSRKKPSNKVDRDLKGASNVPKLVQIQFAQFLNHLLEYASELTYFAINAFQTSSLRRVQMNTLVRSRTSESGICQFTASVTNERAIDSRRANDQKTDEWKGNDDLRSLPSIVFFFFSISIVSLTSACQERAPSITTSTRNSSTSFKECDCYVD